MRIFLPALLLALTSCAPRTIVRTEVVEVERVRYVPVPAGLVQPHEIARGPVSECLAVARARRAELERCNADKSAIADIAGTDAND